MTADHVAALAEALGEVIRSVTDTWDEPLDEVHDVPQIVNAIAASPAMRVLLAEERARALREAADEIGEGDGISRFIGMDSLPEAVRAEKRAQQWLRDRADREQP